MINRLWFYLMLIGIVTAGFFGRISIVPEVIFSAAEQAVSICIGLISIMAFWLGIMRIIEESGLINVIIKILRPVAAFLFPGIPKNHPAMSAILMNMSANLLGMGNAATPFGLKAMEKMQQLNPKKDTASLDMCTFLAINTSSLTLVPATVIALRSATGSMNPTEIIGTTLIATATSTTVAILFDRGYRFLERKKGGMS
ncbi:nucleoside recognition domain-containing protein [Candidatus Contubernalis alkaliaceticus]|uniref:nucleoside recognition domain-containing protein n=1 Tax=Candidatus Contubernalis alkaliaceticus TaxID=338645 RepID=UPI001F4C3D67|nr:nucleoside recognition domain-containing protein [Candidatus Contubernalis alkalaceticus]UNC92506.1 nucleoside recognition protein [Candidatus Contubernalis alkalaceticus]